jgi:hypothetical protein
MKGEWKEKKIAEAKAKGIALTLPSALDSSESSSKEDDDDAATQIEGMDLTKIAGMRAELEKEEQEKLKKQAAAS